MAFTQSSAPTLAPEPQSSGAARSRDLGTSPPLAIAARSILESQTVQATVASVLAERAIDHCWEGLFEYAAIRVGAEHAASLLPKLEREVESAEAAELERAGGPRSRLYRKIRGLLSSVKSAPLAPDAALWWRPDHGQFGDSLLELRRSLSPRAAEVLELRFARRLSPDEIAHVLDEDGAAIDAALTAGEALAVRLLGRKPRSRDRTLEGALLEAFALDPSRVRAPRRRGRKPVLGADQVIAGRYKVEALLGAGAFADVYRARDCDVSDHVVALKILRRRSTDASSVDAALRELQLIASVFHPSVIQLKDHGWYQGHLWFVTPLYRGETLSRRLERGALTRRQAREIFEPLAEALATMHRAGVRHQDVKPENVFLANLDPEERERADAHQGQAPQPEGRILPVLLDLGVAAKDAELVLAGTPTYFAPEVAARFSHVPDPPPVGPKSDVFSLALTLRHALDPHMVEHMAGGAVDAFVAYRASTAPDAPARRDLADLRPCFERWLHVSPDARPSAEELRRELAALTRPEERAARRMRVMRWALPTGVAVLATFAAVVYALSREASLRKFEAEQARERAAQAGQRAASAYASLNEQEARRRALEADVKRLEEEYQTSKMTREQLASRLAQAEGELAMFADRVAQQTARVQKLTESERELRDAQTSLRKELDDQNARSRELSADLQRERSRRSEAEGEAHEQRQALARARDDAEQTAQRVAELEARLAALRRSSRVLPAAAARASQLELLRSESTTPPLLEAP